MLSTGIAIAILEIVGLTAKQWQFKASDEVRGLEKRQHVSREATTGVATDDTQLLSSPSRLRIARLIKPWDSRPMLQRGIASRFKLGGGISAIAHLQQPLVQLSLAVLLATG